MNELLDKLHSFQKQPEALQLADELENYGEFQSYFDQVAAELRRLHAVNQELLEALKETREALQMANDTPKGPINDTIWMMHRPETLFDFVDAAIAKATGDAV